MQSPALSRIEKSLRCAAHVGGLAFVLATADCVALQPAPEPPRVAATQDARAAQEPPAAPASETAGPGASEKTKPAAPAARPGRPAGPPPLDLKTLETRLKETKAIGVFTKIAIKNQVDDLLDQFRAFYQGRQKTTLADLRQPYDRLVLKIVALLQDGDPPLAGDIVASREEIWGILADPVKFANY